MRIAALAFAFVLAIGLVHAQQPDPLAALRARVEAAAAQMDACLLYTSPSPRDS